MMPLDDDADNGNGMATDLFDKISGCGRGCKLTVTTIDDGGSGDQRRKSALNISALHYTDSSS